MGVPLLNQRVNTIIGTIFLGSFALGAIFIILHVAETSNQIADAMAARAMLPD